MKNILNNPIVVVLLCVIAIGYLGYTLKPLFVDDYAEETEISSQALPEIEATLEPERNRQEAPELMLKNDSIDLRVKPRRNPFQPVNNKSGVALETNDAMKSLRQTYLNLNAIIISKKLRLARVNNQLLGVGDSVDDYQIMIVESNYIDVKGPDGMRRITLAKNN